MLTKRTSSLPNVRGPVMTQFAIDDAIVRVGLFFICFITVGVFYVAVTKLPVRNAVPVQQLQQAGSIFSTGAGANPSVKPLALGAGLTSAAPSADASASAAPASSAAAAPAIAPTALPPSPVASTQPSPAAVASAPPASARASAEASAKPSARASTPASGQSYTIQKGDTLSSIARRYGTSVSALETANGIGGTGEVKIGQKISIP